jgi:histone deacetylase 11
MQQSDLDIEVRSEETAQYVERLDAGIKQALRNFAPDLVMFVAGSDAYELDVLPGTAFIKLSFEEITRRDRLVLDTFARLGIPLAMVFAGGYGEDVWNVHYQATKRLVEHIEKYPYN